MRAVRIVTGDQLDSAVGEAVGCQPDEILPRLGHLPQRGALQRLRRQEDGGARGLKAGGAWNAVLKLSLVRGPRTVRSSFSGEGNFIVQSYTRPGSYGDLLFKEVGSYRGKALLPSGTHLVTVHADGS
ncbi:hypothetical protein ABZV14_09050 [Streptosporangium canum]|uniref:hypothetical protein n=1 Tax=Streptosporangium canum TaxID=324952 RepID=UPI0033AE1B88